MQNKYVLAAEDWGSGIIHHYLLDILRRMRARSPGDEYSSKREDNITPKLTQIPEVGMGSPTRDPLHQRSFGDPPEVGSGNIADRDIYGADVPPDDETKPGGGRTINPRGEPIVPTQQSISLTFDDPVAQNYLFDSNSDLDRKPAQRTRHFLTTLYNGREPVDLRHAASR